MDRPNRGIGIFGIGGSTIPRYRKRMDSLVQAVREGELSEAQISEAADSLLQDDVSLVEGKVEFLKALAIRGETAGEIAGLASAFLEKAVDPEVTPEELDAPTLDVCGTGGDGLDLFNISTASIFILAAGGVAVVKHGNRSVTSNCGSADVLEALGVPIDLSPGEFAQSREDHGVGFLFAPHYHPAFKAVVPVRKQLAAEGVRTVFNLLGPLLNPVRPEYQMVGVFDPMLPETYAHILAKLGRKVAWAVHGNTADGRGVDELSTMGPSVIYKTEMGEVSRDEITPEDLALPTVGVEDLQGGDAKMNAGILRGILDGSETGPKRDIVCLNAGAGFAITGVAGSLHDGIAFANELIDNKKASKKLKAVAVR